mgnify:CR=1 FL=1
MIDFPETEYTTQIDFLWIYGTPELSKECISSLEEFVRANANAEIDFYFLGNLRHELSKWPEFFGGYVVSTTVTNFQYGLTKILIQKPLPLVRN